MMSVQGTIHASESSYSKLSELPKSLIDINVPQIFYTKNNIHLTFCRVMHAHTTSH